MQISAHQRQSLLEHLQTQAPKMRWAPCLGPEVEHALFIQAIRDLTLDPPPTHPHPTPPTPKRS